jgi:hypothetical protein
VAKQANKATATFSRRRLNNFIDFARKYPTLFKFVLFFMDLRIRRPMAKFISKDIGGKLTGVEIGTYEGENAYNILKHLSIEHLYCIDPYSKYNEYIDSLDVNAAFETAKKRLSKFTSKVTFIVEKSEDAIDKIPPLVDFVYIDGNHLYDYVRRDIELYYPRVKCGGVIGGHDIWMDDVNRAVFEFARERDLKVNVKYPDWWIIK